jgi:hypothetical protein
MATFTDIVSKQREKGEGIGSSLATAFSERARERLDPRNYLFNRKGTLAALFPGLKGYQSKTGAEKLKGGGSEGLGAGSESILNIIADRLGELKSQFKMVAKNSLVLPQMARDTNLTKMNIAKLVRAQGDTPAKKADTFFKRASDRESQYENAMKAGKPTPAKEEEKKEEKSGGLLQKIFGFLLAPIKLLVNLFSSILGTLTGGLKKLSEVIGSILSLASTAGLINTAKNVVKGVVGVGRGLAAAGAGAGALVANAAGKVFGGPKTPSGGVATKGKPLTDFGSVGQSREAVKNKSLWGRFLAFVERKSPKLFARVFAKLAAAGSLVAIPGPGWILAAAELGLAAWTMWDLYELWKEFNNAPEEKEALSPDQMNNLDTSGALDDAAVNRNMNTEAPPSTTPSTTPSKSTNPGMYALRPTGPGNSTKPQRQYTEAEKQAGFDVRERIGQSEGGATGYNATYGFGAGKQDEMIRLKFGKKYGNNVQLTDLTIEDALTYARQRGENKGALGRYQFMPKTLEGLLDGAGLSKKDKFSAENQDKLYNVFSNRNASALHEAGFQATAENLHLSHFAGAKGAVRILKADPNTLVGTAMGHKEKLANGEDNPVWKTNKSVFNQTVGQYRANLSKMHGSEGPSLATEKNALSNMTSIESSRDSSFDPARIEEIANYRRTIPDEVSTQDSGKININNIDNSKKSSSSVAPSSTSMASAYNYDIINLLLDRVTNPDIRIS